MVVAALAVVVGLTAWGLGAFGGSTRPSATLTLVTTPPFAKPSEQIGGCAEARRDHGRDHDPAGYTDQEDDECISGWTVHRQPDGAPITTGDGG